MKKLPRNYLDITGTSGDDVLIGTTDADTIRGLEGNDTLIGGGGSDVLIGGTGDDIYRAESAAVQIQENVGEGFDRVYANGNYTLAAGSEIELLAFIDPEVHVDVELTGNEFAQTITGGGGEDVIVGGAGADVMAGGQSNDTYRIQDAGDIVIEGINDGGGSDTIFVDVSLGSYALPEDVRVENLAVFEASSTLAFNFTGNGLDNRITGTAGVNLLIGGGGTDILVGGAGGDFYRIDDLGDTIIEASGASGTDFAYVAMDVSGYTLNNEAAVEVLAAIDPTSTVTFNLTGNTFVNTIFGSAGSNTLVGGNGGGDVLVGLGGDDFYRVEEASDEVRESAGGGSDSVYTGVSYTLRAGEEIEVLAAAAPLGTAALNLTGNEFANTLIGSAGVNILIGGGGNDVLAGGIGSDFYRAEDFGDIIVESLLDNPIYVDALYVAMNLSGYTLGGGVGIEVLSVIDPASTIAFNLTGNEIGQRIYGNDGVNTLIGEGGADTLFGGGGNDFYRVEEAGDAVQESAGGGYDSVYALTSYTLTAGSAVEALHAFDPSSTAAQDLTGNALANEIFGNAGANVLDGKNGTDLLYGFAGADTFAFTTAANTGDVDTIGDFAVGVDKIGLDDAQFNGIGGPGALNANAFVIGTAAADGDDRIIYNQATGQLFYDADGSGSGLAWQFALVQGPPVLAASDFTVI